MPRTLTRLFVDSLDRRTATALNYIDANGVDHAVTYADLYIKACAWAATVESRVPERGYVALIGSPSPEWYGAFIGIQLAGRVAAPLSPMYAPQELRKILDRLDPGLIALGEGVRDDSEADTRLAFGDRLTALAPAGTSAPEDLDPALLDPVRWADRTVPSDYALVLHTSGTTGLPKAAHQTHGNYAGYADTIGRRTIRRGERVLSFLPPTHQAGLLLSFISTIAREGHVTQLERFTPDAFWAAVRRHGCTLSVLMSPGPGRLLSEPVRDDDRDHTLRRALGGSTPTEQRRALWERFGIVFSHEQMGSTETTLFALSGDVDRHQPWPEEGLVGPLGGSLGGHEVEGWARIRIADTITGEALAPESLGEIQVHGPGVFTDYLRDPGQTAAAFTSDGWFHTGDLGYQDTSGGVYWVDRLKSMIRRSGESISPAEVEQVVVQYPGIAQAAAFGVPDEIRGEEIMVAIVPAPGAAVDLAGLLAHCRAHLAMFKVPRYVEVATELPLTVSHKIRKEALKDGWRGRVAFDRMSTGR